MTKYLHIANGDDLSEKIQSFRLEGDLVTWREMLCEGPCTAEVGEREFLTIREKFLAEYYHITPEDYHNKFVVELQKLEDYKQYDQIVLWFEFDLFSHMNMLGVINFLLQRQHNIPLFLVCSRKLKGEAEMVPLSELPRVKLKRHYDNRFPLNQDDLSTAEVVWDLYCGKNPQRLASEIKKSSNFEYLASSIRAHLERFPSTRTGLNSLELNVLKLIKKHKIKSLHHLLGYSLKYQGYYGYGDMQMQRVIKKMESFYTISEKGISLNADGVQATEGSKNFYQRLKDDEYYGGVKKYDFLYDPVHHDLLKL